MLPVKVFGLSSPFHRVSVPVVNLGHVKLEFGWKLFGNSSHKSMFAFSPELLAAYTNSGKIDEW